MAWKKPDPPNSDPRAIGMEKRLTEKTLAGTRATGSETNNLFIALDSVRSRVSPEEFHTFMGKNERYLFPLLHPFGYRGSRARPEGTVKDFDNTYSTWNSIMKNTSSSLVSIGPPAPSSSKSDAYYRQKMWETAAGDPIAGAVIVSGAIISGTIGRLFGFEQDPKRAAAAGEGISNLANAGGSLNAPHPVNEMARAQTEQQQKERASRVRLQGSKDPTRVEGEPLDRGVENKPQDRGVENRIDGPQWFTVGPPMERKRSGSVKSGLRSLPSESVPQSTVGPPKKQKRSGSVKSGPRSQASESAPQSTNAPVVKSGNVNIDTSTARTGGIETISASLQSNGSRVVVISGKLLPPLNRRDPRTPNFNRGWIQASDIGLVDYEILHLWGPILGDEAWEGMMYGPKGFNALQSKTIELRLHELRGLAARDGATIELRATAVSYPLMTWRGHPILKEVRYDAEVKFSDGSRQVIGNFEIEIPPPNSLGRVSGEPEISVRGGSAGVWSLK